MRVDIPDSVSYLLIGGGTASFTAARVILEKDPEAKVFVIFSCVHGDRLY